MYLLVRQFLLTGYKKYHGLRTGTADERELNHLLVSDEERHFEKNAYELYT